MQQLPYRDKQKLCSQINRMLTEKRNRQRDDQSTVTTTDLQQLLLQGPTMSDDQWEDFKALRKDFGKWLAK